MADQAVETKSNEAKAETLRAADAVTAPAAPDRQGRAREGRRAQAGGAGRRGSQGRCQGRQAGEESRLRRASPKPGPRRSRPRPAAKVAKIVKPAAKIARPAVKAIKTGVKTMTTQTRKAADAGFAAAEQIKTVVTEANDRAKTAMEKNAKIIEELAELSRGNVEALVASSKLAAKGVETLSQDAANYSRKSFEDATAAFKSFTDVKSATDFFKLQGDFARSAFDSAVAESARVSENVLKLAGDVAEPLTSRYAVAADRVKTLAA